jgi:hypothetical protein
MKHLLFIAASLMALIPAGSCFCQDELLANDIGRNAFKFLDEPSSPRQVAMGCAGTAMPGTGFSFYNPSQPVLTGRPNLSVGYAPLPADYTLAFFEAVWVLPRLFFGASFTNSSVTGIIPTTGYNDEPNYNTPASADGSSFSLLAGYKKERASAGIAVNLLQDRIVNSTAYGLSISAGAIYRLIPDKLTLGLAGFHVGTTTGYLTEDKKLFANQGEPLPKSLRLGASYRDTMYSVPFTVAGDLVYRAVGNVSSTSDRLTVPIGVELWPTAFAAFRMGKRFNFETEVFNFGAGFLFSPLSLDMSFVISKLVSDVEVKSLFSVTYTLRPPKSAPAQAGKPEQQQPTVKQAPESRDTVQAPAAPATDSSARTVDSLSHTGAKATEKPVAPAVDSTIILPGASDSTAIKNPEPAKEKEGAPGTQKPQEQGIQNKQ